MDLFKKELDRWNKEVFGNIFARKKRLLRQLQGISAQMVTSRAPLLEARQHAIWKEYEQVLGQEEISWFLKSRSKWLAYGDRNSKYFHGITAIRRRKNKVEAIQDDEGCWISNKEELEKYVTLYFKNLFANESPYEPFCLKNSFPKLVGKKLSAFGNMVTREEIYRATRCMGGFKALGPDGFQAIFYQSQWNIVGDDFCHLIMDVFNEPQRVEEINDTFITLIPKLEPVSKLKDFRPISLCNVSYKTITKIIALPLRGIIEDLVSPCQCSFIPNHHSSDNIVIAQEVFHSMRSKKGKKGWMSTKVDLEKAYDRLN